MHCQGLVLSIPLVLPKSRQLFWKKADRTRSKDLLITMAIIMWFLHQSNMPTICMSLVLITYVSEISSKYDQCKQTRSRQQTDRTDEREDSQADMFKPVYQLTSFVQSRNDSLLSYNLLNKVKALKCKKPISIMHVQTCHSRAREIISIWIKKQIPRIRSWSFHSNANSQVWTNLFTSY